MLWFAGHEFAHLRLHTPNFYGQNYNTVLEALPGEWMSMLGVPLSLAAPMGTTVIATLCWVVLAVAAYRQRQYVAAALALTLPLVLSTEYLVLFDAPRGVLTGDLFAALTVVSAITIRSLRLRLGAIGAIGGLALLWDQATMVVVLPIAAIGLLAALRSPRTTRSRSAVAFLVGGAIPAAAFVFQKLFYRIHPHYLTAGLFGTEFSMETLAQNVSNPARLFGFYSLGLLPSCYFSLTIVGLLMGAAVYLGLRHRYEPLIAFVVTLASVVIIMSVPKSLDAHPGIFLSGSRFFLPLPLAMWAIAYFTIEAWRSLTPEPSRRTGRAEDVLVGLVTIFCLASVVLAQLQFRPEMSADLEIQKDASAIVQVVDAHALLVTCSRLRDQYVADGAEVLVTRDRSVAYGCATWGIDTIHQDFDRRGWILEGAKSKQVTRILLYGWTCEAVNASAGTCETRGAGTQLLTATAARSIAETMRAAGLPIRGT